MYLPIIAKFVPKVNFRYGLCGSANMAIDALLYFIVFNYVLGQQDLVLPFATISSEIAAFLIVFPIPLFTGFWLAKYVSFEHNRGRTLWQSVKYLSVVVANIAIKYFGITLLVYIGVYPSMSNILITIFTVMFSYLMQRHYTFRPTPKIS